MNAFKKLLNFKCNINIENWDNRILIKRFILNSKNLQFWGTDSQIIRNNLL